MKTQIPARICAAAFAISQVIAAPIAHYTFDVDEGGTTPDTVEEDPGDPGTIGGPNNSVLTTDASGNATVRLTLTGNPKDFVRAVRLP